MMDITGTFMGGEYASSTNAKKSHASNRKTKDAYHMRGVSTSDKNSQVHGPG